MAQTPPKLALDARVGLWEVTSTTNLGGIPGVDTSKISPQQQAQIAAMTSAMAAKPTVIKSCMTAEKFVTEPPKLAGTTCQQTIQTNTSNLLETTMTCTGERPSRSIARTEFQSPTAFAGTVTSTSTARDREMIVTVNMSGKWLGTDCGDVK
jgi:hypothetical protein